MKNNSKKINIKSLKPLNQKELKNLYGGSACYSVCDATIVTTCCGKDVIPIIVKK